MLFASRRARQSIDGVREGDRLPPELLAGTSGVLPFVVPYEADGRRERLVYFSREGDLAAYEELRSGFTAAVSHELRTPLARLLTLLETATLPGEDVVELVEQATREVEQITELIDEILFLSELESGARVVSLGPTPVRPVLEEALAELAERASRAGVELRLECAADVELAIRPRMLRVLARNLAENAIRYAGPGTTFTLGAAREDGGAVVLSGRDNGIGVEGVVAPAPVRALLPGRPGSSVSRHRARPRDRQAHRDPGGRNRRRERRAGQRSRDPLRLRRSGLGSPDFHRMFTSRRPGCGNRPERLMA